MRVKLNGNDNRGEVFLEDGRIVREIDPDYLPIFAGVLKRLDHSKGFCNRIIASQFVPDGGVEHEKLPISYPFEWSPSMLRDATLAQLDLWIDLQKIGLTLKDAMPTNYLFKRAQPVLVDVLSVVPTASLKDEEWLVSVSHKQTLLQAIMRIMFLPFFAAPLVLAAARDIDGAHHFAGLSLDPYTVERAGIRALCRANARLPRKLVALWRFAAMRRIVRDRDEGRMLTRLRDYIAGIPVLPADRGYLNYYEAKGEAFDYADPSNWKPKQRSVSAALEAVKPKTVLDLGANTGWFSVLASRLGSQVIATDIDVSCVDALYRKAHAEHLDILGLKITFSELEAAMPKEGESLAQSIERVGHVLAGVRLKADLVLCLGLIHHLTLGEGRSIAGVLATLHQLTGAACVVEFISLDDPLVRKRPDYFPNIASFDHDRYSEAVFERDARLVFQGVERMASHPPTRTLWLLRK